MANPDRRENYKVHKDGPRKPTINTTEDEDNYIVNYKDAVTGFVSNGTLPVDSSQGVHSLTDVPVFAQGPCMEKFGGELASFRSGFSWVKFWRRVTLFEARAMWVFVEGSLFAPFVLILSLSGSLLSSLVFLTDIDFQTLGVYNNIDIFFNMAACLGLARDSASD